MLCKERKKTTGFHKRGRALVNTPLAETMLGCSSDNIRSTRRSFLDLVTDFFCFVSTKAGRKRPSGGKGYGFAVGAHTMPSSTVDPCCCVTHYTSSNQNRCLCSQQQEKKKKRQPGRGRLNEGAGARILGGRDGWLGERMDGWIISYQQTHAVLSGQEAQQ